MTLHQGGKPPNALACLALASGVALHPPNAEHVIKKTYTEDQIVSMRHLFQAYGMDLLVPPSMPE